MDSCPLPFSPPALSSARVSDSRESTRRRSGCFLRRARGTWAGGRAGSDAPRGAHPHGSCRVPWGARAGSGIAGGSRGRAAHVPSAVPTRARAPPPGTVPGRGLRGGHVRHGGWARHRHGAHVAPMWEPGRGPCGPEASLCAGPSSGTWHSGRAGGERGGNQATEPLAVPARAGRVPPARRGGRAQRAPGWHGGRCPGPGHVPRATRGGGGVPHVGTVPLFAPHPLAPKFPPCPWPVLGLRPAPRCPPAPWGGSQPCF